MARRVFLLVILLLITLTGGLAINSARAFRERVFADPRAKTIVTFRTTTGDIEEMTWATFVLKRTAQLQVSLLLYLLINQPVSVLWSYLYGVTGLAGGCLYLLLLIVDPAIVGRQTHDVQREFAGARFAARLLVSAATGVLSYFIALLPASIAIIPLEKLGAAKSEIYSSLLLLPATAGIFASTFFERLRLWLERTLSGKSKTDHPREGGQP